jgi:hypothetical protein
MALPERSHAGCDKPFKLPQDSADILDWTAVGFLGNVARIEP